MSCTIRIREKFTTSTGWRDSRVELEVEEEWMISSPCSWEEEEEVVLHLNKR